MVFNRLRKYNLKMNPLKCAFDATSGKFLGFIVRHRGIEVDPAKINTNQKMPPPRNLKSCEVYKAISHSSEDSYQTLLEDANPSTPHEERCPFPVG
ncbi:UNVERIFIED_CONTAM: hypothetical protein Sradi_3649800 [Sesamum radiatum]|uniref:Reverse transcriptase n=1 Tax=Sesamum radiatum TaxID=300843 RepID=A0AAW2QIB1_SESRA